MLLLLVLFCTNPLKIIKSQTEILNRNRARILVCRSFFTGRFELLKMKAESSPPHSPAQSVT